jgi:Putative Ig domain
MRSLRVVVSAFTVSVMLLSSQAVGLPRLFPPPAKFEEPYSFNLQDLLIQFGQPPYTYQLVSGSLPAGLAMDSSGEVTGTPASVGTSGFTVKVTDSSSPPQQKTLSYFIPVSIGFDTYGGLTAVPIPGCAQTGYFQLMKVNGRWVFADPNCNAFYQRAVYDADRLFILPQIMQSRYGNITALWANHSLERITSYGFNAVDIYYSLYMLPVGTGNNPPATVKIPFNLFFNSLNDVLNRPNDLGLPEPVKDICRGFDSNGYQFYCSNLADIFDPKWVAGNKQELINQEQLYTGGFSNDPWITAISLGDTDYIFAIKGNGAGPAGTPAYPHPGMLVATANFQYSGFQDNKLYSKYTWMNYLQKKYVNIAALNAAWGTGGFYTTFGDAGGFGTGTGVLDEDGRHTGWFSSDLHDRYFNLSGVNSNLAADLAAFLYQYTYRVYSVQTNTIRTYDQNHLFVCGTFGGVGEGGTRLPVLRALKDAGCNLIVGNWNSEHPGVALAGNKAQYDATGLPEYLWYAISSQADSDVSGYPENGVAFADYPSQPRRAQQYAKDQQAIFAAQGSNGDYYLLGTSFWSLTDNSSEKTNFGLLSYSDNAYDGRCAVIAQSTDPYGYPCGGETANYGDFLDSVTQTHSTILQKFIKAMLQ